jgi:hypothetical protein
MAPPPILPPILGSLEEVCIVTPDLYKTQDGLTRLGLGPFRVFTFNSLTVPKQELPGQIGSDLFEILVAFVQHEDAREPVIEIMQPMRGQTVMQDYLDTHNNQEGVQHVAFNVQGLPIQQRKRIMQERGIGIAMQGWWKGGKGECNFVYFDTKEQGMGTCFESIEFGEDWEEPEGERYPAPPKKC